MAASPPRHATPDLLPLAADSTPAVFPKRILVMSPHPDDDGGLGTCACTGLLSALRPGLHTCTLPAAFHWIS